MRTSWIVQTNVEPESTSPLALRRACEALGNPFFELAVTPRSLSLPPMPHVEGPAVLHGRTTLILRALEHPTWRRGIFFDPKTFRHDAYVAHYGPRMLNADARVVSWSELQSESHRPEERVFLKPNDDFKDFTGGVFSYAEISVLHDKLVSAGVPAIPTSSVVVSQPREVDAEWRIFLVDGRAVAGSMYRPTGDARVPDEVFSFAEDAAAEWAPAPVFVLDVARSDAAWWVVECNCFNGSRFLGWGVSVRACRSQNFGCQVWSDNGTSVSAPVDPAFAPRVLPW